MFYYVSVILLIFQSVITVLVKNSWGPSLGSQLVLHVTTEYMISSFEFSLGWWHGNSSFGFGERKSSRLDQGYKASSLHLY